MLPRIQSVAGMGLTFGLIWGFMGCGGMREDRTPAFSPNGNSVAFQHGRDGLFVWDAERGGVEQIYLPPEEVIATSTPLWSPDGNRLVFTTATIDGSKSAVKPGRPAFDADWDANPEGRVFSNFPAIYDCWLCERGKDRRLSEPRKLFQARTNHVGMIAANLAVRWHPNGDRLLYIQRTQSRSQQVMEFDMDDATSRAAVPFVAKNLLFDWTPDGKHLACLVQDPNRPNDYGIWIGHPDKSKWWHVPFSNNAYNGTRDDRDNLPALGRLRPVWSRDGRQFAFVAPGQPDEKATPGTRVLRVGELATQSVRELHRVEGTIRDVHWSPDGNSLGYLLGTKKLKQLRFSLFPGQISDALVLHKLSKPQPVALTLSPVRNFAGWNAAGTSLAYTVPSPYGPAAQPEWAFLLVPREAARDRVIIADAFQENAEREVFSGMRAAFLNWSPQPDQLALWATFEPSHEELSVGFLSGSGGGLRPGDPAAILDTQSGELTWMPINAREKIQIGHYSLIQKNYAEALRWYEEAETQLAAKDQARENPVPPDPFGPEQFELFHSYCLKKLGETELARKKMESFFTHTNFKDNPPANAIQFGPPPTARSHALSRQLYIAQVFLSLEAIEDGLAFFDTAGAELPRLVPAETLAQEQFAAKVAHAQLLLNAKRFDEFTAIATSELVPALLEKNLEIHETRSIAEIGSRSPDVSAAGFCLLPLMAEKFIGQLSEQSLSELIPRWESFRAQTESPLAHLWIDRFLELAYQRSRLDAKAQAAQARYEANPQQPKFDFERTFNSEFFNLQNQLLFRQFLQTSLQDGLSGWDR